jgi:hypothetical protein
LFKIIICGGCRACFINSGKGAQNRRVKKIN